MFYSTETLLFHSISSVASDRICTSALTASVQLVKAYTPTSSAFQDTKTLGFFRTVTISTGMRLYSHSYLYKPPTTPGSFYRHPSSRSIVVFVHAIATKAPENVSLLEQVMSSLASSRKVSVVQSVFTRHAPVLSRSLKSCAVTAVSSRYLGRDKDTSIFPDSTSLFHPEAFQNAFDPGDMNHLYSSLCYGHFERLT